MLSTRKLRDLLDLVMREQNADRALDQLSQNVLELTASRNALIARMNDELGVLELRHGMGQEWSSAASEERLSVDISKRAGIVAYVAASGETFMSGNVQADPRYRKLFHSTNSEIAVPINDRFGRMRAVLNVESEKRDAYTPAHVEIAEVIASMAAIVMEQHEASVRELALMEIGRALDESLTEEEVLARVVHIAGEVLRFQAFSVFLWNPQEEKLILRGSSGGKQVNERIGVVKFDRGEGCTGWVCDTGRPILLDHPQQDPRWLGKRVEFPSEEIASYLAVPVISRGKCLGVLRVVRRVTENKFLDNRFTPNDQRVLTAIAEQLATALDSIRAVRALVRSEQMSAWGELSAKSSHMIGNRVFALKGDVNELRHMLEQPEPKLEDIRELQKSLQTNVQRIEEILQDFRDFVTATKVELHPVDVNALVEGAVTEVFPRRSEVELELDLAPELPQVAVDPHRMRRAISELVENSMNFVTEGKMRARTALATEEELHKAKVALDKTYVKIEIEDTGPGVDAQRKELIFQPFYSSRVKGMGLGLSIVKGIVDAHGGTIFEAGEEGSGAKFVILLPAVDRLLTEGS